MLFNKFKYVNNKSKKILHKIGKHWVTVSVIMLSLISSITVMSNQSMTIHADSNVAASRPATTDNIQHQANHMHNILVNHSTMKLGAVNGTNANTEQSNTSLSASDTENSDTNPYNFTNGSSDSYNYGNEIVYDQPNQTSSAGVITSDNNTNNDQASNTNYIYSNSDYLSSLSQTPSDESFESEESEESSEDGPYYGYGVSDIPEFIPYYDEKTKTFVLGYNPDYDEDTDPVTDSQEASSAPAAIPSSAPIYQQASFNSSYTSYENEMGGSSAYNNLISSEYSNLSTSDSYAGSYASAYSLDSLSTKSTNNSSDTIPSDYVPVSNYINESDELIGGGGGTHVDPIVPVVYNNEGQPYVPKQYTDGHGEIDSKYIHSYSYMTGTDTSDNYVIHSDSDNPSPSDIYNSSSDTSDIYNQPANNNTIILSNTIFNSNIPGANGDSEYHPFYSDNPSDNPYSDNWNYVTSSESDSNGDEYDSDSQYTEPSDVYSDNIPSDDNYSDANYSNSPYNFGTTSSDTTSDWGNNNISSDWFESGVNNSNRTN